MQTLFEYIDLLSEPCEAFHQATTPNEFPIQTHWHFFTELLYVTKDQIIVEVDNDIHYLNEGDFILIYPKSMHRIYKAQDFSSTYIVIKFDDKLLKGGLSYLPEFKHLLTYAKSLKFPHIHFTPNVLDASFLCHDILEEYQARKEGYDILIQANLQRLFILILRYWKTQGLQPFNATAINQNEKIFDDILTYIDTHYHESLEVGQLATNCHLSYSQFSRQFKLLYGYSCKEYINYVRINKAQDLLLFTDADLTSISTAVGFSDSSHLIKQFKQFKQLTPYQYKKQYKRYN